VGGSVEAAVAAELPVALVGGEVREGVMKMSYSAVM